jgi:hypothetical protein
MYKKQNWKKVKIEDFMDKINFFFSTMPFSPWAVLATWLHVGAPHKIRRMNLKLVLNKTSLHAYLELE